MVDAFLRIARSPVKFRLYLFSKIPSAYFSGIRIREIDLDHAVVTIPFKRFTQNPFRSIYFACLSMAAEMSTGVLAMAHCYQRQPAVSMLVTGMEAAFHKKAVGVIGFTCTEGSLIKAAVERAVATGEAQTVLARSVGRNAAGEVVAEFNITWSFKARSAKTKS